jgi:tetratricopeptide (TPR) repeat protein
MSALLRCVALAILAGALLPADTPGEQPVGLVLSPSDGKVVRAGSELPLAARSGDVLFAGDALRSESAPVSFLYCPEKSSDSLAPKAEVLLEPKQLKLKSGRLAARNPVGSCFLPQVVRVAVASQQHYGVTMVRALRGAAAKPETLAARLQALPEPRRQAVLAELKPLEGATDPQARVARAAIFEKYDLREDALEEYQKLGAAWPDAVWVRGKIFELEEALALAEAASAARTEGGKTLALVVGVSRYQRLPQSLWLQYAHADATVFGQHLLSPRGGGLPAENLALLINEKATTAAIRNAFETFLKGRATKKDTVVLFLAAHGTAEAGRGAYILTYDSDPQDLAATALPMADVQKLIQQELANVGRVLAFVDVCRAGTIGAIRSASVNLAVDKLGVAEGEIFGLMASRPREFSFEGPEFGGGHGAFSYYLLKALNGEADKDHNGVVDVNEVIKYVGDNVAQGTRDRQHPREFGNYEDTLALSDNTKPGIQITGFSGLFYLAMQAGPQALGGADADVRRFQEAIGAGHLLPDAADGAFQMLARLKPRLAPEQFLARENELRVALEDRGQQVLLRYLTGDQVPQTRADFASGASYFDAARRLTPESLFLEGREDFCQGRARLFEKDFRGAADLLEKAARLDPGGAYSYNALGIAYLEQADYGRAAPAFRDSIRRAPYWAYPLHNLALAYSEMGDYANAVKSYQQAIRLAPQYSYLPYNLGLLYQRLNRRKDAEAAYRKAMALAPASAEPYNALGSLKADAGRAADAERLYRQALEKDPNLLAARHNLALLLAEKPQRSAEAIRLWQANIAKSSDHLPSRLSLAETLARAGQAAAAADQYRAVVERKPDYVAARVALADLLAADRRYAEALEEVRAALKLQPQNADLYERVGDLEQARGNTAEAARAYGLALAQSAGAGARRKVRRKLAALPRGTAHLKTWGGSPDPQ